MDYQGIELREKRFFSTNQTTDDEKDERTKSPNTNARTNCSTNRVSYEARAKQKSFILRRPQNTASSMRRSHDINPEKTYSNLHVRDSIERRDIATAQTAGAVDLKIKQDLFAKDI